MNKAYVAKTRCSIWLEQILVVGMDTNKCVLDVQRHNLKSAGKCESPSYQQTEKRGVLVGGISQRARQYRTV